MSAPERQVHFRKALGGAWTVLVDGAVIGRAVPRDEAPLANRGMGKIPRGRLGKVVTFTS